MELLMLIIDDDRDVANSRARSRHGPLSIRQRTFGVCVALLTLAIATAANAQPDAAAAVFRCKQPNGGITYQDYPCKGGVSVDIKPDVADPEAIARLRRAEAEFDRTYAQRRASGTVAQRRALIERRTLEVAPGEAPEPGESPEYLLYGPLPRTSFERRDRRVKRGVVVPERRIPVVVRRPQAN
jgi:hypothetical protein